MQATSHNSALPPFSGVNQQETSLRRTGLASVRPYHGLEPYNIEALMVADIMLRSIGGI